MMTARRLVAGGAAIGITVQYLDAATGMNSRTASDPANDDGIR
jgi:hypothetical protein